MAHGRALVFLLLRREVGAMSEAEFLQELATRTDIAVLELGTRRSRPDVPTHHRGWCHPSAKFVMSDFQDGLDVDVLADIHALHRVFAENSFDVIICCSVFEHVQRPWIAACEMARVLKPGGMIFLQTHQSFPLHGFPTDYWRFTTDSLRTLFEDAGLRTVETRYLFPAQIVSEQDPGGRHHPAFLNVNILATKPTPWHLTVNVLVPRPRAWRSAGRWRVNLRGLKTGLRSLARRLRIG
jgi:SAM-dependent methyltransferase